MSADESALLSRILVAMEQLMARIEKLEAGQRQHAQMGLTIREVEQELGASRREQEHVNGLLAARLGCILVREPAPSRPPPPPRPRPDLRVVADNTPPEGER
jgi:hypothetical protein